MSECYCVYFLWGKIMEANELIKNLEDSGVALLDNQAVMDSIAGGCETLSVFGNVPGSESVIAGEFTDAMPDAQVVEDTLEVASPETNYDNSLGLT